MRSTRHSRVVVVIGVGVVGLLFAVWQPGVAQAEPGVVARVSPAGLSAIADLVPVLAPSEFELAETKSKLAGCPFGGDTEIVVRQGKIAVDWIDSKLSAQNGELRAVVKADFKAELDTKIDACLFSSSCKVQVASGGAQVAIALTPKVENGVLTLERTSIDVNVSKNATDIHFGGCGLAGSVFNLAVDLLKGKIIDAGTKFLSRFAEDELQKLIESALGDLVGTSQSFDVYRVDAALTDVDLTDGLAVEGDVTSSVVTLAECAGPAAQAEPTSAAPQSPPTFASTTAKLNVAVATGVLSDALTNAWRGGLLCQTLETGGANGALAAAAALLLDLPAVAEIAIKATQPPQLNPVAADGATFDLVLPGVAITIASVAGGTPDISLEATLRARAGVALDRDVSALTLEVDNAELTDGKSLDAKPLPKDLLKTLNVGVSTLLLSKLSDIALLPQASVVAKTDGTTVYVYFARIEGDGSYVYLYGDFFAHDDSDDQAPVTSFAEPVPASVTLEDLAVVAHGTDNQTPLALLRYKWRLDGGEWTKPSGNPRLRLGKLELGSHTLELVAIDLAGNEDPSPESATFEIIEKVAVTPNGSDPASDPLATPGGVPQSGGCAVGADASSSGAEGTASLLGLVLLLFARRRGSKSGGKTS